MAAKYNVTNIPISFLLDQFKTNALSVPTIQRPFVWNDAKVRDLIDSLYRGYPIGYIILLDKPDIFVKGGGLASKGSSIIDGQQRITAIAAAIGGMEITDASYSKRRIRIAFNPINEVFRVADAAVEKDGRYIKDISEVFGQSFNSLAVASSCYEAEHGEPATIQTVTDIHNAILRLRDIISYQVGLIELSPELEISDINVIFTRINSKGVNLSSYDFVMSKLASDVDYGGYIVQKTIDYFCHIIRKPGDWSEIRKNDPEFAASSNASAISWVASFSKEVYVPDYSDILQTALIYKFRAGWVSYLVHMLNGRDFKARDFKASIAEASFQLLSDGVLDSVNENNLTGYISLLENMGIVNSSLVRSDYVLNFGYALFLFLKERKCRNADHVVKRWIAMSILTGRYSSYPGMNIENDIQSFASSDPGDVLSKAESLYLDDSFWTRKLTDNLVTSSAASPYLGIFLASLERTDCRCFLRNGTSVTHLLGGNNDLHHIFPKQYLIRNGIKEKKQYNQIANMICMEPTDNRVIGDESPNSYMADVISQCSSGEQKIGDIMDMSILSDNLRQNCIPDGFENMDFTSYDEFLQKRRVLMAEKIHEYYLSL